MAPFLCEWFGLFIFNGFASACFIYFSYSLIKWQYYKRTGFHNVLDDPLTPWPHELAWGRFFFFWSRRQSTSTSCSGSGRLLNVVNVIKISKLNSIVYSRCKSVVIQAHYIISSWLNWGLHSLMSSYAQIYSRRSTSRLRKLFLDLHEYKFLCV